MPQTTRGERIRRRSGDIGQGLIIGDAVQVAFDGSEYLILLKPDGSDCQRYLRVRSVLLEIFEGPPAKRLRAIASQAKAAMRPSGGRERKRPPTRKNPSITFADR